MSVQQGPPVISVIIPVHNGTQTIGIQLDALAEQDFDLPWEVIVSDNGSTDTTRDAVFARRADFPAPLRIGDSGAGKGAAYARNAAVLVAQAERLAFCDDDDAVAQGWLRAAYNGLEQHDVVGGPLRYFREPLDPQADLLPFHSVSDDSIVACNVAIRRQTYMSAGGFDATFMRYGREDHEFSVRLWKIGATFGYSPEMLVYYRIDRNSWQFVRKVYSSSIADVDVWRRHPDVYPRRQGRSFVLREALGLPLAVFRAAREGGVRRVGRELIGLAGHIRALVFPQEPLASPQHIDTMSEPPQLAGPEKSSAARTS